MPLSPDAVAAICRHMAQDHAEDGLLICRTLGDRPTATGARAVDVDAHGMTFEVTDPVGHLERIVIAFLRPVQERADVRGAVVELHGRAVARSRGA